MRCVCTPPVVDGGRSDDASGFNGIEMNWIELELRWMGWMDLIDYSL